MGGCVVGEKDSRGGVFQCGCNTCCNPNPSISINNLSASISCLSASLLSFCAVIHKCRIVMVLEYKSACGKSIPIRSL